MPPKKDKKAAPSEINAASAKNEEKVVVLSPFLLNFIDEFTSFCIEEQSPIIPDIIENDLKSSKQEVSKQEVSKQEIGKQHMSKQEMSKQEMSKQEISEQTDEVMDEQLPPICKDTNPTMNLVCESIGKQEIVKQIKLQNFRMHINLLKAIGRCLQIHTDVCVLMIINCKLTAAMISLLAEILEETKTIKELILDLNPIPQQPYHMLLQADSGLQILSLRQCSINDDGIQLFADELGYRDPPRTGTLEVLNLTANHITSKGIQSLANALRTNRTLMSLSLAGNKIDDSGAIYIADILKEFPLTHEEAVFRRQRNFRYLTEKKMLEESKLKLLQGHDSHQDPIKAAVEQRKREKQQSSYHINKRLPSQASKFSSAAMLSSHMKLKDATNSSEEASSTQYSQPGSPMNIEDNHPFIQEVQPRNLALWCTGNLHLNHLNLAYNLITSVGVFAFLAAIRYQETIATSAHKGLVHISLHGNPIPENCFEYSDLERLIYSRFSHFYSDPSQDHSYVSLKHQLDVKKSYF